jgi:hypothetical protein
VGNVSVRRHATNTFKVKDDDPAHASYVAVSDYAITLPGRAIKLDAKYTLVSDEKNFNLTVTRRLSENGKVVREKRWDKMIPRNLQ